MHNDPGGGSQGRVRVRSRGSDITETFTMRQNKPLATTDKRPDRHLYSYTQTKIHIQCMYACMWVRGYACVHRCVSGSVLSKMAIFPRQGKENV